MLLPYSVADRLVYHVTVSGILVFNKIRHLERYFVKLELQQF